MRHFGRRLAWIWLIGLLVFAVREIWGLGTAGLTPILAAGQWDTYTIARWTSLLGTLVWAVLYLAFHTYIIALLFRLFMRMPWRAALVMQAYAVSLLIFEKALILAVFSALGYTVLLSFLSLGPLAATFLHEPFLILFFNQLTIITALIIGIQYRYARAFTTWKPWLILTVLILAHIVGALITASMSYVPFDDILTGFMERGGSVE
ncbi:hypothetical protein [Planococcus lenghuensis]|nr:hypothetical protein [Planococcus lenghuensis]